VIQNRNKNVRQRVQWLAARRVKHATDEVPELLEHHGPLRLCRPTRIPGAYHFSKEATPWSEKIFSCLSLLQPPHERVIEGASPCDEKVTMIIYAFSPASFSNRLEIFTKGN
jgi:hypothetical protein